MTSLPTRSGAGRSFDQQVTFLPVANLERSHGFYGGVLELPLVLDQGDCRIYQAAGTAFIGVCVREPAASRGVLLTLVTSDVDGWHHRLSGAGVQCDRPPARNDHYNLYHVFYRDPDGHVVEIQTFLDPDWPAVLPPSRPPTDTQ